MKKLSKEDRKYLKNNSISAIELEIEKAVKQEMEDAKKQRKDSQHKDKSVKITDINKLEENEIYDENTVYLVYNRKERTENYVNGIQAEYLKNYPDTYFVKFEYRQS